MSKLTLKQIAAHFGVAVSTVSKALHDSYEISESLKSQIKAYAIEHNYRPNRLAISLLNKNTKTIGVVIPNILNYFFVQVLFGVEKEANKKGYSIITCSTNESFEKEEQTLEFLRSGAVDGLILSTVAKGGQYKVHQKLLGQLLEDGMQLVLFDRVIEDVACDKVVVDDVEAGYKATKYFLDTQCQSVAVVNPIPESNISQLRIEGYKKALAERDILFDPKLIVDVDKQTDIDLSLSFLLNYKTITAIMVLDEITAVQVMQIVRTRGYHVPNDIAIIGFTNGQLSKYVTPSMTMISQHGSYVGETAAKVLIDRIERKDGKMPFKTKIIKTSLLVRESTKPRL
ncbi:LacI-type transcriptional regulator [Croceitalea dokdonensis DOKDO 023]|uniref:LacI-type transcriptional regulator n=1 Tax=Croceitalea dokdonensis DOKDO 023 TaxID=1300341 RepID=A0A0N8H3F1_9FLAO|nr:LacI family DNA-binding transcriptional regulator [Croceitalea dokdonensis]KPM30396.1 LacI-type transcriptional regulator [Croceitalea dokdonensis DOKDO 023]